MNHKLLALAGSLAFALVACPNPTPTADFTISSVTPSTGLTFTQPASGTSAPQNLTVTIAPTGGFADAVTLSVAAGGPAGITGSGTIPAGAPSGTLAVTITNATPTGTNNITVQAVSGSITRTSSVPITVNAPTGGVATVTVAGPTGFTGPVKLYTPTQFTATAKDASNNTISGVSFTWSSSDPNVVSVDNTGLATAKKISGTPVTITATASGKSGTASVTRAFGLEVAAGTYNIRDASNNASLGLGLLMRIRDSSGAVVSGNVTGQNFTITGPTGWNAGAAATATGASDFLWGTGNAFAFLRTPPATNATSPAAVVGEYTVTGTIASVSYTGKATISSITGAGLLPPPTISTATVTGSGGTRTVSATWGAVTGAASYRVLILKNGGVVDSSNQTAVTRTVAGITFTTGDTFLVRVIAYPVDITTTDVTLPAQFNISSSDKTAV